MKPICFVPLLFVACLCLAQENSDSRPSLPGNVTLRIEEYNRLVDLAAKPVKKPEPPPVAYSLKNANLKFRVENDSVLGNIQLEGEVLGKGITKVPLTSGFTILDARQDGKAVPLAQENGTQVAPLSGPAEFLLQLDAGLPLSIETKRASFAFPVPSCATAQLSLVIPGEHTIVNIQPGLITSQESKNGRTTIAAALLPGQTATVWWATREVVAPVEVRETRFLSSIKTLVTVSEADIRLTALADVTIVQGEPSEFQLEVPPGYELTGATGATLDSAEMQSGLLLLKVSDSEPRKHQFLISMEKPISGDNAAVPFFAFRQAQRETGEVLVEAAGTMELTATEGGSLKRMDPKETNPYLRSLAHYPPQAAFRYHKQPSENASLTLAWVRFPDIGVLAAVAQEAQVTTLVTSEGRSLTEVKLTVLNQAQPFLKVDLPAGATIVSAEVAGEKVKPVQGQDGSRVPLLRSGFRPTDAYSVSFVFMLAGTPFAKKGGSELVLPKLDIPINILQWEVFLPERYKVKDFGGDALSAQFVPPAFFEPAINGRDVSELAAISPGYSGYEPIPLLPGQVGGVIVDPVGAVVPGARVTVTNSANGFARTATSDSMGRWVVSGVPSGTIDVLGSQSGFKLYSHSVYYDNRNPYRLNFDLQLGGTTERVVVETTSVQVGGAPDETDRELKKQSQLAMNAPSANVFNLQQRVAGVLPVTVDVPKAGRSFQFVRPLVLGEETKITFNYSSK